MAATPAGITSINVAVTGLGRAGWNIHVHQMRQDGRFKIVSVTDPEPARRKQAQDELQATAYETFEEMLEATPAELVIVASPSAMHEKHVCAAMEQGKHVVVEKPMALDVAGADRMSAVALKTGRHLLPHHNHRFGPVYGLIKQTIESGKLGKIFHIAYCLHSYRLRTDWQTEIRHGGGELNNTGSHMLDLVLRLLGGSVRDVLCDLKHVADAGDAEDHVKIFLRAANGVTADIEISTKAATGTHHAPLWTVLGDAGSLTIDADLAQLKYYDRSAVPMPSSQGTLAAVDRKYTPEPQLPWKEETVDVRPTGLGNFYPFVYRTLREGAAFPVQVNEVREVIDLIARCRAQNPSFNMEQAR